MRFEQLILSTTRSDASTQRPVGRSNIRCPTTPISTASSIHRVFVDNRTNPVTFWTGSNHGAAIVKVEAPE